jgi:hypothetical protein
MRTRTWIVLCAALGGTMAGAGCRAIDGLGGLRFDPTSTSGGEAAGGGVAGAGGAGGSPMDAGGAGGSPMDAGGAGGSPMDAGGAGGSPMDAGGMDAGGMDAGDAACAPTGYDCEAAPPAGWTGPVAFYEGAPGTVPGCPAGYPSVAATGTSGISAPPGTCSACTCGAPTVTCSAAPLELYSGSSCSGTPDQTSMLVGGACATVSGSDSRFAQEAPQATVGACAPAGGVPDLPVPTWATAGVACGTTATPISCGDGTWCAPAPAAPFAPRWCVWASGAQTCPAGFPQPYAWETADDERGCTPCACGAPGSATCAVTTALYSDGACKSQVADIGTVGQCVHQWGVASAQATTTPSGSPICSAGGGSPTGSVVTTPAVTICCPG